MKLKFLLPVIFTIIQLNFLAQTIDPYFYGINHWAPKKYIKHPNQPSGKVELDTVQKITKLAGAMFYRIGGNGYDTYGDTLGTDSTGNDYIRAMDIIQKRNPNAKFIVQVPFKAGITPAEAGQLVLNISTKFPGDTIWFSIGNEWDKYGGFTSSQIKDDIINFATAMKIQNPAIQIVCGDIAGYNEVDSQGKNIMKRLFSPSSADNILGQISGTFTGADGKYFCDVASFHSYGGAFGDLDSLDNATYSSLRTGLMAYPSINFYNNLLDLRKRLDTANASRSASPIRFGVTEFNVCYRNPMKAVTPGDTTSNIAEGIASRSWFAGTYWADAFSEMLNLGLDTGKTQVLFVTPWSIHESSGDGDTVDLGMTKGVVATNSTPPVPLPTYHHYQLMSKFINKGVYVKGQTNNSPNVKSFSAAVPGSDVRIMILNRNNTTYNFSIGFNGVYASGSDPLQIKFPFSNNGNLNLPFDSIGNAYYDVIGPYTTMVIQFNCRGSVLEKVIYTMSQAANDSSPQLRQIGNINVNPSLAKCNHSGIGGTITSNTTFSNTTVYVTSDILLAGNTNLTFDNAIVIVSPGVEIKGTPMSSIDILNKTTFVGCDGKQWKGIYMIGNYHNGERIKVEDSYIFHAKYPIRAEKIQEATIKNNVIANGEIGIELNKTEKFTVTGNTVGGFKEGLRTSNTIGNQVSQIARNHFMDVETALKFISDNHNQIEIACNRFKFSDKAIKSTTTTLKDQGDATIGAGNVFERISGGQPFDFVDHSGSSSTYYFGPVEGIQFNSPNVMNIPKIQSAVDKVCPTVQTSCAPVGIRDVQILPTSILIYPNPSNGSFTVKWNFLTTGDWTINVHDVLGRVITSQKINSSIESTTVQLQAKGLYFVSLQSTKDRFIQKVLVE